MSNSITEQKKLHKLVLRLQQKGIEADVRFHWIQRMIEVCILENGKTVYQEFAWLDNDWSECKIRKMRHDVERFVAKVDCGRVAA